MILWPIRDGLPPSVRATLFMVGAMAAFSAMGVFIRLAAEGVPTLEIVFFRNFFALLLLSPLLLRHGVSLLANRRMGLYCLRGVVNLIAMMAGFTALTLIPLAEATALGFTAPIFATIGAVLVLGEAVRARRMIALAVGFAGTLIVLRPGLDPLSLGALLALVNAALLATNGLIVKKLTDTERPEAIVIWMVLLQSPLSLVPALFVWQWPDATTVLWLVLLAASGSLAHLCWTNATALAEVSHLQPFEFAKLPFVAAAGFLLFGEVPTLWTWLGGGVIFLATAYLTHRETQLAQQARRGTAHPAGSVSATPDPDR